VTPLSSSPETPISRRWYAYALLLGIALRAWFILHHARIDGDTLLYGDIARNWLQHGVYGFTRVIEGVPAAPRPTLIRLPGYPLFLAACFRVFGVNSYIPVMCVQALADLASCVLLASLAGRLFGPRARLAALWLGCLCPFTANYVAEPLTETLTLFTIALAFFALERWQSAGANLNRWLPVLAAALAYSILLRPEQGLLAAAIVPAMLGITLQQHRPVTPILLVTVLTLVPFVPWTIRNARTFHVFQPLAPRSALDPGEQQLNGFPRWYRTWAIEFDSTEYVYWNYWSDPIEAKYLPARAYTPGCTTHSATRPDLRRRTVALLDDYNRRTSAMPAIDARFDELARERIQAGPLCYYISLPLARVLNTMLRPRTELTELPLEWWRWHRHPAATMLAGAFAAVNLAYLALAGAGFFVWQKRGWLGAREIAWAMAASILLRSALLLTLDNSEPRYTLEFYPVLLVLAGALFARCYKGKS